MAHLWPRIGDEKTSTLSPHVIVSLPPALTVPSTHTCALQFLSLLQNNMITDMVVLYAAERKIITIMRLGVPVCGHPTIVHGKRQERGGG